MHGRTQMRSQSALDFLSTYSFMFLIIAIALAILLIYASLPNTVFPLDCNMYNTFQCVDAILTNTTVPGQSQLLVVFADQEPGTMNISSFTPTLNYKAAASGVCTPSVAQVGQRIYCVATFDSGAVPGRIYSGTLKLSANYCANGVGNMSYINCHANSNYSYGGFIRIEASTLPTSELPLSASNFSITVNNTQSSGAIPAHFDVPISFNPKDSALVTHERPDLGNVRFYYGSKELYSWCEANCSSSATGNALFWVRVPTAIPPIQSQRNVMNLQLYLLPITTEYDGIYAGEAPQLSSTYAEYDNGANVFKFYDNFAGKSLSSEWTNEGITYAINNGFTATATAANGYIYSNYQINQSNVVELYGNLGNQTTGTTTESGGMTIPYVNHQNYQGVAIGSGYPSSGSYLAQQTYGSSIDDAALSGAFSDAVLSIYLQSPTTTSYTYNYGTPVVLSSDAPPYPINLMLLGAPAGAGAYTFTQPVSIVWFRVRGYPPSGVMPTVTITTT